MELHDRIALVRKAKGLTQEQLGELVGVTRQAVSKWEAGQAIPDALTAAKICQALEVSADYVLLGKEPEERVTFGKEENCELPVVCPCCGRSVSGTLCPTCGYPLPTRPPRGSRYALVAEHWAMGKKEDRIAELIKYCGMTSEMAEMSVGQLDRYGTITLLRRNLSDDAVRWISSHLSLDGYALKIVEDLGESEDLLVVKQSAMELPPSANRPDSRNGIGFWGVVGAVIVALLILSFF